MVDRGVVQEQVRVGDHCLGLVLAERGDAAPERGEGLSGQRPDELHEGADLLLAQVLVDLGEGAQLDVRAFDQREALRLEGLEGHRLRGDEPRLLEDAGDLGDRVRLVLRRGEVDDVRRAVLGRAVRDVP